MKKITAVVKATEEYLERGEKEYVEKEIAKQLSLRFMKEANLRITREKRDSEYTEFTLIGYIMSEEEARELRQSLYNIKTHLSSGYLHDRIEIIMESLFK